ncbi:uncharacterized protein FIBRA_05916 [Fibroporia radiculosa]|uniref:DRBM domain-containing protein n=1 Tax=Fibroporia radiculosa TaxID=599839 RepID=J4H3S8_9APHY|nr:uncharacterized protein FIBRA_05916 [Fibroporia radiculosa]CCM03769.1 predicted protein [Fibroporia radiculosa]
MANEGTVLLNNWLQARNRVTSLSWEESTTGPRHSPQWTSVCKIDGQDYGRGTGAQKHLARDIAAKAALERLIQESE